MREKAPMPPWWVREFHWLDGPTDYEVCGGTRDKPVRLFFLDSTRFSNAKELADLIVQRTKQ